MKQCVVTGASGLIGKHLIRNFPGDWLVHGLSRTPPEGPLTQNHYRHLALDLAEEWEVESLPRQVDAVIHLAQSEHFRDFPGSSEEVFRVNTLSTLRLLDYARKANATTFVLASSGGVYGYGNNEFSEEKEIISRGDLGFYLATKLCSEVLAENFMPFMHMIILRFFFVYGPGQRKSMLIPRLVQSVLTGKPITLQGQEGIRTNPIYVSDAVNAVLHALELKGSHKINVGGPAVLNLRQIGETIAQHLNLKANFLVQSHREPRHLVGDIRKMTRLLTPPTVPFQEGITHVIKEFKTKEWEK